jgi:alkanesulfonate monooxygenase SsuD/methylene tetrahydromethanopterin reductase-like flavin-dependent oxidoreductase (luciferase family)
MTVFGFHASHEQVHPSELIAAAQLAEQVGFTAAMCSDHFSPWSERQGSRLRLVLAGGGPAGDEPAVRRRQRAGPALPPGDHRAGGATLSAMYPGRFWAALGTGEASNEHITGQVWPRKDVRNARLRECVDGDARPAGR